MEVRFKIPDEKFNQLNQFYMENFGYDIYTQIQNFIFNEMKQCGAYSTEPIPQQPRPKIIVNTDDDKRARYKLVVTYPDDSELFLYHDDYSVLMGVWNEWSKYAFSKDARETVYLKLIPDKIKCIQFIYGLYRVIKVIDGKKKRFGNFKRIEDAIRVKNFLDSRGWDTKYYFDNLIANIDGCHRNNYSKYLLKIVDGEMEL